MLGLTVLMLGYAPTAFAQPADWVIVPTSTVDDISWMQPTVRTMGAALSGGGTRVLSPGVAVTLFEQKGSGPPKKVTDAQIQRLDALMKEALRLIVVQEHSRALEVLTSAQKLTEEAIAELNRTKARSENVLDTCLYMVRALYDTVDRTRAKEQARHCVRLVPGGDANLQKHPPEVVELYEEAGRPSPEKTGSLTINSKPQGCDARINGLRLGQTPFTMTDLYPGDYQVQVECDPGRRGRVRQITIGTGNTEVFVDVDLDRAVRTEPLLRLQYPDEPEAERQARDARGIAEVLQVRAVVLASVPAAEVLELRVVKRTEPTRVLLLRLPMTPTGPTAKIAADATVAVANDQCKDFTGPKPVTIKCPGAPARPLRPPRRQWISGLTLVSAGGASLIASYALLGWRRHTGNVLEEVALEEVVANPSDTTHQTKWLHLRGGIVGTAAAGGALTVAAMPLFLPYRSKTPWWAWLSGGLGLGAAIGSIVSGVTAGSAPASNSTCEKQFLSAAETQACVDRGRSVDRAIVLGATAAPLLTIPLVYLFRTDKKKPRASVIPSLGFGPTGGSLAFRGRF
jgi:hypothetical protein